MMKRGHFLRTSAIGLTTYGGLSFGVLAAPQQLDCVLTNSEAKIGSEKRPISVVFDEEKHSLTAQQGNRHYSFGKVSISNVSINGQTENVSLGIDRSSLGIVWQEYDTDKIRTEYGRCSPTASPT